MIMVSASEMGDASLSDSIFTGSCSGIVVSPRLSVLPKFESTLLRPLALPLPIYPTASCLPFPFGRMPNRCSCLLMNALVITELKCLWSQTLQPCTDATRGKKAMRSTKQSHGKKDWQCRAGNVATMLIQHITSACNYACTLCQAETRNLG